MMAINHQSHRASRQCKRTEAALGDGARDVGPRGAVVLLRGAHPHPRRRRRPPRPGTGPTPAAGGRRLRARELPEGLPVRAALALAALLLLQAPPPRGCLLLPVVSRDGIDPRGGGREYQYGSGTRGDGAGRRQQASITPHQTHRFSSSSTLRRRAASELKPPPVEERRVPRMEALSRLELSRLLLVLSWLVLVPVGSERRWCTEVCRKARCRSLFLALYDDGVRFCVFFVRVVGTVVSE